MTRHAAERRGRWGEELACWWLRLKGWRILARRVKARGGEIDIVARKARVTAFIEVKTRSRDADLDTAIDMARLERVAAAARILSSRYARAGDDVRLDVILVRPGRWPVRIENVWHGLKV